MIVIKKPFLEDGEEKSRVLCEIAIDDDHHIIWFEVPEKYKQYLCTERSDAHLIGMLNYAMRNHHDICCETPVTEELLYGIEKFLIPTLSKHSKNLYAPQIITEVAPTLLGGTAVGTGASLGVDSLYTIRCHTNSKYKEHNLTHLCINNVGAFNECYDKYGRIEVKNERYRIAKQVADELSLELIQTDSNFGTEIYQNHYLTHTYSSVFAIYSLQKLWKIYYYSSSGKDFSAFSVKNTEKKPPDVYELLSLQCFSTSALQIWSDGGAVTRLEKTASLVNYTPAQKYIHVCIEKPYNCGKCGKCRRTLITLDLLDALDGFRETFDVDYYLTHRKEYYSWLCYTFFMKDKMNRPVYNAFLKKPGFRIYATLEYLNNIFLFPMRFSKRIIRYVGRKIRVYMKNK